VRFQERLLAVAALHRWLAKSPNHHPSSSQLGLPLRISTTSLLTTIADLSRFINK
jgi:hypothetical protein